MREKMRVRYCNRERMTAKEKNTQRERERERERDGPSKGCQRNAISLL